MVEGSINLDNLVYLNKALNLKNLERKKIGKVSGNSRKGFRKLNLLVLRRFLKKGNCMFRKGRLHAWTT